MQSSEFFKKCFSFLSFNSVISFPKESYWLISQNAENIMFTQPLIGGRYVTQSKPGEISAKKRFGGCPHLFQVSRLSYIHVFMTSFRLSNQIMI